MPTHANDPDTCHVGAPAFASAENRNALVPEQQPHQGVGLLERTTTAIPTLRLVELTSENARPYYDLADRNRGQLTQHGDYADLGEATPESVVASLNNEHGGTPSPASGWTGR